MFAGMTRTRCVTIQPGAAALRMERKMPTMKAAVIYEAGGPEVLKMVLVQTLQAVGIEGDNGQMRALDLFKGRQFNREVIVLCVRWYLGFKLSSRDLVQMMAERRVALTQ